MNLDLLKKLGFTDKTAKVYLALLQLGPSSVRKLAEFCDLNRGTTYDALKWLQEKQVVNFYKEHSKQQFVAENPEKLHNIVRAQENELEQIDSQLGRVIPEFQALYSKGGERPIAKYFHKKELNKILEDVLETCEESEEKLYRIYSTAGIREFLYEDFSTFSDVRIAKGISVRVIAIGEGGELRGLDERKWLKQENIETPTYIILYPGKSAYISLDAKGEPVGVVVENEGVYETQKFVFDNLFSVIPSETSPAKAG